MMPRNEYYSRGNLGPFEDISQDLERVFDSLLGRTVGTMLRTGQQEKFVPALDVSESKDAYMVHVDLPGVDPANVKVEMHDGKLVISGKRESRSEDKDKNYHRIERSGGSFYRSISVDGEVDVDNIEAKYEHGVLNITLPKLAKQQPKQIQIKTGT
jgi:HSP20 family protein